MNRLSFVPSSPSDFARAPTAVTACVLVLSSLACGGSPSMDSTLPTDADVEASAIEASIEPEPEPEAPAEKKGPPIADRVEALLRSSDAPVPNACSDAVPKLAASKTIAQWLGHLDEGSTPTPTRCGPCAGHVGKPFEGAEYPFCDGYPETRGYCELGWSEGDSLLSVRWLLLEDGSPILESCSVGFYEGADNGLDEDELEDLEAMHGDGRPLLPGAPVEGIRYWAPPGDLEAFLTSRSGPRPSKTVRVSSAEQLLKALDHDTLILLEPGRYLFEDSDALGNRNALDWSMLSPFYTDNAINHLKNLVIAAATSEPTVLIQPDAYAPVLTFDHSDDVGLFGLTIGHRPDAGFCRGDVLRVVHSKGFEVAHTTLFGSGTKGITSIDVDGLRLRDSVITDSSEGFGDISDSRSVRLERVEVAGNTADLLRGFTIHASDVILSDVRIHDNKPLRHAATSNVYGLLFTVGEFDPATALDVRGPARFEARQETRLELVDVTVDGTTISWPP